MITFVAAELPPGDPGADIVSMMMKHNAKFLVSTRSEEINEFVCDLELTEAASSAAASYEAEKIWLLNPTHLPPHHDFHLSGASIPVKENTNFDKTPIYDPTSIPLLSEAAVVKTEVEHPDIDTQILPQLDDRFRPLNSQDSGRIKDEADTYEDRFSFMDRVDLTEEKFNPLWIGPTYQLEELTKQWLKENCVVYEDYFMPRGEIYAVYVDDLRNKYDSISLGLSVFSRLMLHIFPSIKYRFVEGMMDAQGIRFLHPHVLAPSSMNWGSPVGLEVGDFENITPTERKTREWIRQNCIEDANSATPCSPLYAAYMDDFKNDFTFLCLTRLSKFKDTVKAVFPSAHFLKFNFNFHIRGVRYVGPHVDVKGRAAHFRAMWDNVCDMCGMSFKFQGHLNRHIWSHVGGKPFQCSVCMKKFAQKRFLNTHQLHTHCFS